MVIFILSSFAFVLALYGLFTLWSRHVQREIDQGASLEWDALNENEPELIEGYDKKRFDEIYRLVHFPRFPGYAVAAIIAFIVSLPAIFILIGGSILLGERLGLLPKPIEIARYIPLGEETGVAEGLCTAECQLYLAESFSGFYFFFAIIFVWLAIFGYFMHRYHACRPGFLREELIRNRP